MVLLETLFLWHVEHIIVVVAVEGLELDELLILDFEEEDFDEVTLLIEVVGVCIELDIETVELF